MDTAAVALNITFDWATMTPDEIASKLPMAYTGGYRESTHIVRTHATLMMCSFSEHHIENIIGALMRRSRDYLSRITPQGTP